MIVARSAKAGVLNQLATILRFGVVGDLSDSQLLERYLTGCDGAEQAAFAALVERHGPMVLSVCRHVLRNRHDADDAFQATFLVLARKAGSVRNGESLASWLHGIALRAAVRAKGDEARRRLHEQRCATLKQEERGDNAVASQLLAELHEEIARLPARYREPVVLCYLQGLSSEQAAGRIGCPIGTVWSRLSTARARLRGGLLKRGVALPTALLAGLLARPVSAAMPRALLDAAVHASMAFVGRRATEAAMGSQMAITLAREVLCAMVISKWKTLGGAALACALALGGAHTLSLGQTPALPAPETAAPFAGVLESQPASGVARLVQQLKRHPAEPKAAPDRLALYLMDLASGEVTLIADQPAPGLTRCGSACWSHDGRRILYDATPGTDWRLTRLESIELGAGRPTVRDLGAGNCPSLSPADDQIFFLSNADGVENGVWLMRADGSERRRVAGYGKPMWSPDGRQLMIMNNTTPPHQVTLMDVNSGTSAALQLPGHQFYAYPSWADEHLIIAAIGASQGDTIALIDVSDPPQPKVKRVLWRRANGPDVEPSYPIYSAATGLCVFVGKGPQGQALCSVQHREAARAKPIGPREGDHPWIGDLAYSPDGRYLLYSATDPCAVNAAPQGALTDSGISGVKE
jgi:RNA polymerase sigma factor (sigma-70 family)